MPQLLLDPEAMPPLPANAPPAQSSPAESIDPATDSDNLHATDSDNLPLAADSNNVPPAADINNLPPADDSNNLPPADAGLSITGELTAEMWLSETDDPVQDRSEPGLSPPAPSTSHKLPSNTNTSDAENVCDAGDDVENVCDAVKGDITSTYSPQSDMVPFDQLHLFPVATLTAGVYYNPDDEEQRPITLAVILPILIAFPAMTVRRLLWTTMCRVSNKFANSIVSLFKYHFIRYHALPGLHWQHGSTSYALV